jgi:hypothetical protein
MVGKYVMILDGAKNSKLIKLGEMSVKVTKKENYKGPI